LIKLVAAQKRRPEILPSLDYPQILITAQFVASKDHKKKRGEKMKSIKLKILQRKSRKK